MEAVSQDRLEKIARMEMLEVPYVQIATAIGVSPSRVTQICESAEYKEVASGLVNEYYEQHQSLNDAWDTIEARAARVVLSTLEYSRDADFAMKAAMLANKANRRGNAGNRPIDTNGGNGRAVISLANHFIQRIQNITIIQDQGGVGGINDGVIEQKRVNILSPEKVEGLLSSITDDETSGNVELDEDVGEYFGVSALA